MHGVYTVSHTKYRRWHTLVANLSPSVVRPLQKAQLSRTGSASLRVVENLAKALTPLLRVVISEGRVDFSRPTAIFRPQAGDLIMWPTASDKQPAYLPRCKVMYVLIVWSLLLSSFTPHHVGRLRSGPHLVGRIWSRARVVSTNPQHCGFVVQQAVQHIQSKSTTNRISGV